MYPIGTNSLSTSHFMGRKAINPHLQYCRRSRRGEISDWAGPVSGPAVACRALFPGVAPKAQLSKAPDAAHYGRQEPENLVNHHAADEEIDEAREPAAKLVEQELGGLGVGIGKAFCNLVKTAGLFADFPRLDEFGRQL